MDGRITIELEVTDNAVAGDIIDLLELTLPYIADNVIVSSSWDD